MAPYFVIFFVSIVLCGAGERMLRFNQFCAFLLFAASVAAPVVLAGARDFSVGTDIEVYGNYIFNASRNSGSLLSFLKKTEEIEPMYKALSWAVSRFTNNPHWMYFVTSLIICACIMAGLYCYRRWCPILLGWTCFLFLFYGDTLNTMRQCLALAIVFWGIPLFMEKKYLAYAVLQGIAVLFHVTGVIAFLLVLIYLAMKLIPPRWVQFFFIFGCMGVILFYSPIVRIILQTGLLPAKFSRYIAPGVAFALNPTILRLPFLFPILFYYDRFCGFEPDGGLGGPSAASAAPSSISSAAANAVKDSGLGSDGAALDGSMGSCGAAEDENGREPGKDPLTSPVTGMFIVIMLLLEICTVQLRSVKPALYRISFYFGCFRFPAYARLVRILRRDNRAIAALVLVAYLCIVWYYQNVVQGNNQIFPYVYDPGWMRRFIPVMPAE